MVDNTKSISIRDILSGCQCAIIYLAGEPSVIRCVTCPLHGDIEFKEASNG